MPNENQRQAEQENPVAVLGSIRWLLSYRKALLLTLVGAVFVVGVGVIVTTLSSPRHRIATLRFMLEFEGAEDGQYPSQTKFSPRDITSEPVLRQVFESNDLQRFLTYEEFARSAFVYETSTALELLTKEYEAKLSNLKLSPIDRATIEAEFQTKRDELKSPEYALHLQRSASAAPIPAELEATVLPGILATWADWATRRKGVVQYNIPSYSPKIVSPGLFESEEYLVAADLLRQNIENAIESLQELKLLPGSHNIRIGDQDLSLAEIAAALDELLQYKLEPLVRLILQSRLARDMNAVQIYLETRLSRTVLEKEEAQGKIRILEDALSRFLDQTTSGPAPTFGAGGENGGLPEDVTTSASQFDDPFLEQLLSMATRSQDAPLRQQITRQILAQGETLVRLTKQVDYYRSLLELFSTGSRSRATRTRATTADYVKERFEGLEAETLVGLELISSLYEEISRFNLNPRDLLYTTVGPVSFRETRGISPRNLALYSLLMVAMAVLLFPLGCIVHHSLSKKPR